MSEAIRARVPWTFAGVLILVLGLGVRAVLSGWVAKYLGVALWSTLVYQLIVWVSPKIRIRTALSLCIAISFAVELLQLTPGPMWLYGVHPAFALVFGTTFNAPDLPAYVAGSALGAAVHWAILKVPSSRSL